MTDHLCKTCGTKLMSDEIALHMKLFSRASKSFMCLDCQAAYLDVERGQLEEVIERYHRSGTCVLFAKWNEIGESGYGRKEEDTMSDSLSKRERNRC